ncbi:MAG: hypothetical protein JW838_11645 [Spirochaetes bacterium]|nr:hypothetical protein [Spirochaetota bacterium]
MKNNCKRAALAIALFVLFAIVTACDSTEDKSPYLIINVNLDEVLHPVSAANKLYAIFYVNPTWSGPWLTLSSASHTIITPRLTIGTLPFCFEVLYDADGDGQPSSGDLYQGWSGKTNRGGDLLDPVLLPKTDLMILNVDLDNNGTIP